MTDLEQLRAAEDDARALVVGWFDYEDTPEGEGALDAYREAIERRLRAELAIRDAAVNIPSVWVEPLGLLPSTTITSECHCGRSTGAHEMTSSCDASYVVLTRVSTTDARP